METPNLHTDPFLLLSIVILATGSRDGSIATWDLRCNPRSRTQGDNVKVLSPTRHIQAAHCPSQRRLPGKNDAKFAVTTLEYLGDDLVSGGAVDGRVKIWDMRYTKSVKAVSAAPVDDGQVPVRCTNVGVASICISPHRDVLYMIKTDRSISLLSPTTLTLQRSFKLTSEADKGSQSFYIKSSLSPDGRFLAMGSSSEFLTIWDTTSYRYTTLENGHRMEVSDVAWRDTTEDWEFASCSDDPIVRTWRVDHAFAKKIKYHLDHGDRASVEQYGWVDKSCVYVEAEAKKVKVEVKDKKQTTMDQFFKVKPKLSSQLPSQVSEKLAVRRDENSVRLSQVIESQARPLQSVKRKTFSGRSQKRRKVVLRDKSTPSQRPYRSSFA